MRKLISFTTISAMAVSTILFIGISAKCFAGSQDLVKGVVVLRAELEMNDDIVTPVVQKKYGLSNGETAEVNDPNNILYDHDVLDMEDIDDIDHRDNSPTNRLGKHIEKILSPITKSALLKFAFGRRPIGEK